jgi:hypothetical protein
MDIKIAYGPDSFQCVYILLPFLLQFAQHRHFLTLLEFETGDFPNKAI